MRDGTYVIASTVLLDSTRVDKFGLKDFNFYTTLHSVATILSITMRY